MSTDRNLLAATRAALLAVLLAVAAMLSASSPATARPDGTPVAVVRIDSVIDNSTLDTGLRAAVDAFIRGMAHGDAEAVWMFASEEDQDAFGTEQAVYDAFADVFPALIRVEHATLQRFWREGDTPFLAISLRDQAGRFYRATMGFWLDDAGDWKLVSCKIEPLSDRIAGR